MSCSFKGCCGFPHGTQSKWAVLFSVAGTILAKKAIVHIVFMGGLVGGRIVNFSLLGVDNKNANNHQMSLPKRWWWPDMFDSFFQAPHQAAIYFGLLGHQWLGIATIASIAMSCMTYPRPMRILLASVLLAASVCEAITTLIFALDMCENRSCKSVGTCVGLSMGACVLSFLGAAFISKIRDKKVNDDDVLGPSVRGREGITSNQQETVTTHTDVTSDGSKSKQE